MKLGRFIFLLLLFATVAHARTKWAPMTVDFGVRQIVRPSTGILGLHLGLTPDDRDFYGDVLARRAFITVRNSHGLNLAPWHDPAASEPSGSHSSSDFGSQGFAGEVRLRLRDNSARDAVHGDPYSLSLNPRRRFSGTQSSPSGGDRHAREAFAMQAVGNLVDNLDLGNGDSAGQTVQTGLVNLSNQNMSGAQVGLVNAAYDWKGLQLGLINRGKHGTGLQIGLLNFSDGKTPVVTPIILCARF